VRYEHSIGFDVDSQATASDEFVFCLSDGVNSSPTEVFLIQVSRDNARRLLVRNREMVIRDGETKVRLILVIVTLVSTNFISSGGASFI